MCFSFVLYNISMSSKQSYIQKYVLLKIESGSWGVGEWLLSETQFANKFSCSRLTVRNALQKLVISGVLKSVKGKGYVVNHNPRTQHLNSWAKEHIVTKTELIKVDEIPDELVDKFDISKDDKVISFIKNYYSENDKIIATQYTLLNKNIIWESNFEGFRESITNELARQGILVKKNDYVIKYDGMPRLLAPHADCMGYGDLTLIEEIYSWSEFGWVEKSIRVTAKEEFKFTTTRNKFI